MYISPVSYSFGKINSNINNPNRISNITINRTAFTGKKKATEQDLLQSEMFTEYNVEEVRKWANQYEGYTTTEDRMLKIIYVKDENDNIVRRITKDNSSENKASNKVYDDAIMIYDEDDEHIKKRYIRRHNGFAELAYGGYNGSGWNIYVTRKAGERTWTECNFLTNTFDKEVPAPIHTN